MQNIFDIHDYDEGFLERFTSQTIPIYDLWSVRPLQNEQKELISGGSNDAESFRDFITDHSNQEFPHPLVIVIGNAEKTNVDRMSNTSKKYFKLKFEKFKGNDLGTPLTLAGSPQPYPTNNQPSMEFMGMGTNNRPNPKNANNPMQGFSLGDIHGIIDRNVADATRSIKAEYEEQSARREADNIKRLAELETRMEMYKLDMREKEVHEREKELKQELQELEQKRIESLGTVSDYTKTIAGGIFEFGKSAFGIEDKDSEPSTKEVKTETKSSDLGTTSIDNDGFTEVSTKSNTEEPSNNNLDIILNGIANLDEEQKMALLDALIPENIENTTNKKEPVSIDKTNSTEIELKEGDKQKTNEQQSNNNQKSEKNEDI